MGLIVLSTILSIVVGSCLWLVIGDRFPLKEEQKYPVANNIFIYAVLSLVPVYLTIFVTFSFFS